MFEYIHKPTGLFVGTALTFHSAECAITIIAREQRRPRREYGLLWPPDYLVDCFIPGKGQGKLTAREAGLPLIEGTYTEDNRYAGQGLT